MFDSIRKFFGSSEVIDSGRDAKDETFERAQQEFSHQLLIDFFRLAHEGVSDNYDHNRYSYDGSDHSGVINVGLHAAYLHWYFSRASDFYTAYTLFKDQASRDLFRRLVLYRMLGHIHVRIKEDATWSAEMAMLDKARQFDAGPSSLSIIGMFGPLRHHEGVPVPNAESIKLDCWSGNVAYTALKRQYFFAREGVSVAPECGDVVFDAGACFGDTAAYFAATVGDDGHVYAFDPLPSHNEVVEFNIRQNNFEKRLTAVPFAVGEVVIVPDNNTSKASVGNAALPGFSMLAGDFGFPVTTLDKFAEERLLSTVDFIKMDIEGFEMPALLGAQKIIKQFRPKLAISLYHKPFDIIEIPIWLATNFPEYELYLDHYTIHQEETVLYAVVP